MKNKVVDPFSSIHGPLGAANVDQTVHIFVRDVKMAHNSEAVGPRIKHVNAVSR